MTPGRDTALEFGNVKASLEFLIGVSASSASAGCWVLYFRWKDKQRPEPWWMLVAAIAGGLVSVPAGWGAYGVLEHLGYRAEWEVLQSPSLATSLWGALVIGGLEESLKLLPVVLIAVASKHFDELLDGLVYAPVVAIGFATAESWALFSAGGSSWPELVARTAAAPLSHAILAAPAGYGAAVAVLQKRWWALPAGLGVTVAAHAGYDWFLARPTFGNTAAALLILALWIWVIRAAPKLAATGHVER